MDTLRHGVCIKCDKEFTYSIGTPHIPLKSKDDKTPTILDWWNSIGMQCYRCAPLPAVYQSQCGVLMWRNQ